MTVNKGARLLPPLAAIMVAAGTGLHFKCLGRVRSPKQLQTHYKQMCLHRLIACLDRLSEPDSLLIGCFDEKGNCGDVVFAA